MRGEQASPAQIGMGCPSATHSNIDTFYLCLSPEVHHVYIGSEAQVIGEIPAGMIWIGIDGNAVGVPVPVAAVSRIIRRYVPIPVVELESSGRASVQSPHVLATVSTFPAAVFPRVLNAIVLIVAAGVVADPACAVYMRVVGMTAMILKVPAFVVLMQVAVVLPRPLNGRSSRILAICTVPMIVVFCECRKSENEDAC
jgi:hypothetical protein